MNKHLVESLMSDHFKRFVIFFVLGCWVIAVCRCDDGSRSVLNEGIDFKKLLEAARSTEAAASLDLNQFKYQDPKKIPKPLLPDWPIYSLLLGEVYRLRGDTAQAKKLYKGLVQWAATDPYADGWGVSGMVPMALWRWLQIIERTPNPNPEEGKELLESVSKLWNTRLVQGMFEPLAMLCALPQLEEDILRRLTSLAWSIGEKEEARRLFIEYLSVSRTAELSPLEKTLLEESVSSGMLSLGQVALFVGKRLERLGNYEGALHWLNQARESGNMQVKAEASLYLALLRRIKGEKCATPGVLELLAVAIEDAANPEVVQEALFTRGIISVREGCTKNFQRFERDLNELIEHFPLGQRADDALINLAVYQLELYWRHGNDKALEEALGYFEQLRNFKGPNDFLDSSMFRPAIALYARGRPGDIQRASSLLLQLEKERPSGPLHLAALFWLGRMAAESGDGATSERYFKQIIQEKPYDYYAIRARMHLSLGNQASKELLIDSRTRDELQKAYHDSKNAVSIPDKFSGVSPYHLRLRQFLDSRGYLAVLDAFNGHQRALKPPQRLETVPLEKLDEKNMLIYVTILLALRQDALAAVDLPSESANRLEVAMAIREFAKDWPLLFYVTEAIGKPYDVRAATQRDPRYLSTTYSVVFKGEIEKYSSRYKLPAELIYGVIRYESGFHPEALSWAGALGLFQFTQGTFWELNKQWRFLEEYHKSSMEDFILDPELSIYLGARYFKEELLRKLRGDPLLALMAHISGAPAVREWVEKWKRIGRANDYEFMAETARHQDVGPFVRSVLAASWIAQSARIYQAN